jgi:hypothetical protein
MFFETFAPFSLVSPCSLWYFDITALTKTTLVTDELDLLDLDPPVPHFLPSLKLQAQAITQLFAVEMGSCKFLWPTPYLD